ncbi:molecular chaperone (plasmid) [Pantoea dispersa]|uniref:fimbrial biogenesis chaperone n=1 Tax=Pantoea dispersa TaxID=59814 RepID=UPI001CA69C41|nr:molecular chaperone [Pantoea dispersa]QZY92938.1 molecular chaperone [Pantoea dispersa]
MLKISSFIKGMILLFTVAPLVANAVDDKGGFSLGSTRVIYNAINKEANITVINSAENAPFLAQSWLSNIDEVNNKAKPPFVLTPPLYRQDKGKNTLRIVKTGGDLPKDRESAFWINVKAIPSQSKSNTGKNTISFAYVLKIKMFYRPSDLKGKSSDAYRDLTFSRSGSTLKVNNPTPYYVTLNKISVGGKEIKDVSAMVPPFQSQNYHLDASINGSQVEYRSINDMGGTMPVMKKNIDI